MKESSVCKVHEAFEKPENLQHLGDPEGVCPMVSSLRACGILSTALFVDLTKLVILS